MSKNEEIAVDHMNPKCTYMYVDSSDFIAQITWNEFT